MRNSFSKKIIAIANLAFCFAVHLFRKLLFWKKNNLSQFEKNYGSENFLPLNLQDQMKLFSFSACLNCRLCDSACPALFKLTRDRFPGPSFVLTTSSRSFRDLWASSLDLSLCQDCEECIKVCPNNIDVKGAMGFVHKKVVEQIQYHSNLVK